MKSIALVFVLFAFFTASAVHAQTPVDPSGHWKGTIEIPNNPVDFELDLARNSQGAITGTITASADKVTLPLGSVAIKDRAMTFYARADQPFHGELAESGKTIAGTATLNGYNLPFTLSRTGDAHIEPEPTSPAVTKQLEGTWNATLAAGGLEYHLIVTIANRPDGTSVARSISVEEGGLNLPVVVSQSGPNVRFTVRAVASSYVGTMNAGGTEIIGTWTQRTTTLPLTFKRAPAEGKR